MKRKTRDEFDAVADSFVRMNPTPNAWRALGPDAPYVCESDLVGRVIPGRRGGVVTSCATPRRKDYADDRTTPRKGAKGQVALGLGGLAGTMVKARARRRLTPRELVIDRPDARDPMVNAAQLAEHRRARDLAGDDWIPVAPGLEFPTPRQSPGRCSPRHPLWRGLEELRADVESNPLLDPGDAGRILADEPRSAQWLALEDECLRAWDDRVSRRIAKTGKDSPQAIAARRRGEAIARGEESSTEYLEQISDLARERTQATAGKRRRR